MPSTGMAGLSAGDAERLLHTELALDPNEVCDTYSHTSDEIGDVTFNLKDFKHMLRLCEAFNANVMLSFGMPGAAVVAAPAFAGDQVSAANARASWHCSLDQGLDMCRHALPADSKANS